MRAVWSLCFTIPRNEGTYQENPTVVNSHSWFDQPLPLPDTAQNAFLDHEISQDVKIHLEQGSHREKLTFSRHGHEKTVAADTASNLSISQGVKSRFEPKP